MPKPSSSPHFASAQEAEHAFYDALTRGDLDAMMHVWSEDEEVICVMPGGSRAVGLAAIREAWRQLFASEARLTVRLSHAAISHTRTLSVHSVLEHVSLPQSEQRVSPMIATNVFSLGPHGWRMLMHHASPIFDADNLPEEERPHVLH